MMKKTLFFFKIFLVLIFASNISKADVLLEENFNYTVGTTLEANGYTSMNSGNSTSITGGNLSYNGYYSSGIGNSVTLAAANGLDYNKSLSASVTSNSVYMSFLVSFVSANTTGDYFINLGTGTSYFYGRLYVKKDANNKLAFAVNRGSATSATTYTGFNYDLNTTYLMVIKYSFVSGTANDVATLYIDPAINGTEPSSPTLISNDATSTDATTIDKFYLRTTATTPSVIVDGVRVATTWEEAVKSTALLTSPIFSKEKYPSTIFDIDKNDTVRVKVNPNGNSIDSVVFYRNSARKVNFGVSTADSLYKYINTDMTSGAVKTWFNVYYKDATTNGDSIKTDTIRYTISKVNEISKIRDLYTLGENTYAKYVGEAVVTNSYKRGVGKYIYIQDSTAAILVYDNTKIIPTAYTEGDKVSKLFGSLATNKGQLTFTPLRDSGKVISQGNTVISDTVSANVIKTSGTKYMSKLVTIKNANFKTDSVSFKINKSYDLVQDTSYVYAYFADSTSTILGKSITTKKVNVTGIFLKYTTNAGYKQYEIVPMDIYEIPTSAPFVAKYYNPASKGLLSIDAISVGVKINPNNNTIDSVRYSDDIYSKLFSSAADSTYKITKTTSSATTPFYFNVYYKDINGGTGVFKTDGSYTTTPVTEIYKLRDFYTLSDTTQRYLYKGEALITYVRNGKQVYAQDSTAGILLYSAANNLGNFVDGDIITKLLGKVDAYGITKEFVPTRLDSSKVLSHNNTITPKTLTVSEYKKKYKSYASQIIKIEKLKFITTGGVFGTNSNYKITDEQDTMIFYSFGGAEYNGDTIKTGKFTITGIAAAYVQGDTAIEIGARYSSDFIKLTAIEDYTKDKKGSLLIAPNPVVSTFTLNIDVEAKIAIYNIAGQKVKELWFIPGSLVDVSDLPSGKYIVATTLGDKAYSKVLIKR